MLKNKLSGFGYVAILMHWLMAVAILFPFGLGLYMVELTYYDGWYKGSTELHKSLGLLLWFLWLFKLLWSWLSVKPETLGSKLEKKAAAYMHGLMYLLPLLVTISGYLISTADGRSIMIFEFLEIGALPISFENQEDQAGFVHWLLAWALIAAVGVHALAALKHHFIDKDKTLMRMLWPQA